MQTIDLILECDQVMSVEATQRGQDCPHLKVALDDVLVYELVRDLVKELDAEVILDHLEDRVIREYLDVRELSKLQRESLSE